MLKKFFLLACCFFLVVAVLSGCGGASNSSTSSSVDNESLSSRESSYAMERYAKEDIKDLSEKEYLDNAQYNYELIKADIDKASPSEPLSDLVRDTLKKLQPELKPTAWDVYESCYYYAVDEVVGKNADLKNISKEDSKKIDELVIKQVPNAKKIAFNQKELNKIERPDGGVIVIRENGNINVYPH